MKLALKALHLRRRRKRQAYYHAYCSPDVPAGIKPRLGDDCGCDANGHARKHPMIGTANLFL